MKNAYILKKIPRSRVATFDIFSVGLMKHHIIALLEFDVTLSRRMIRALRKNGVHVSFNGWIIKVIGSLLKKHPEAAAYRRNKKDLMIFNNINISVIAEKTIDGEKVPVPMVIEKTHELSAPEITEIIDNAKEQVLTGKDMVINKNSTGLERLYYRMPGFIRRGVWKFLLGNPGIAYRNMGNAVVTSIGMMGKINGWFIHRSVHPVSFGIGSVLKKPVVADNEIQIREILNMTILADHDVIDGAPMVRFLNDLTRAIETGEFLGNANDKTGL